MTRLNPSCRNFRSRDFVPVYLFFFSFSLFFIFPLLIFSDDGLCSDGYTHTCVWISLCQLIIYMPYTGGTKGRRERKIHIQKRSGQQLDVFFFFSSLQHKEFFLSRVKVKEPVTGEINQGERRRRRKILLLLLFLALRRRRLLLLLAHGSKGKKKKKVAS